MKKFLIICMACMASLTGLANAAGNFNYYAGAGLGLNAGVQYKLLYVGTGLQYTTKDAGRKDCYIKDGKVACGFSDNTPYNADSRAEKMGPVYFSIGLLSNTDVRSPSAGLNYGLTLDLTKAGTGFSILSHGHEWGINLGMMYGKKTSFYKGGCNSYGCSYSQNETTERNYGYHFTIVRKFR